MKLHLAFDPGKKNITSHGEGFVAINSQRYHHAVVVTPGAVHTDWKIGDFSELTPEHFDYLKSLQPQIILFGTGAEQHFAPPQQYRKLIEAGISVEFMATPAACYTYNILMNEDRNVLAALLL